MTVDFNDYFWGDKNNGYEVLYQNMKYGLVASKELSEYFRERSNLEEHNAKVLSKLAHKAGTGCPNGTFSPLWVIIKSSAERLSELHMQMVQKVSELVKNISKYADELHKKHKVVKEEESHTQDAVQAMKESSTAVQKAKDLYQAKLNETEKLRRESGSTKEIEKAEAKMKKTHDEYKVLIEKHNPIKNEFERRMTATCRRFQEMEEDHLKQMREFLNTYLEIVQNNCELVGQVNLDFKKTFLEISVEKLLENFVLNKYTGFEKPDTDKDLTVANASTPTNSQSVGSPTLSNLSHLSQPTKKESNLRSWFTFSQNSNSSTVMNSSSTSSTFGVDKGQPAIVVEGNNDFADTTSSKTGEVGASPAQISGFLRSRREKAKSKKNKKSKKDLDGSGARDDKLSDGEVKDDSMCKTEALSASKTTINTSTANIPSLATPVVDEDGYSIKPDEKASQGSNENQEKTKSYSSSDSDSDDEPERKIHVEIKPLNNGIAPISASVDELRATVENLALSPLGVLTQQQQHQQQQQQQSPIPSNASTPTAGHPYAPLQSPTFSTNRYADLGDLFSEVGEMSASAPASANLSRPNHRSTPTSANSTTSSIAIPRPPSRRSEAAVRGRVSPASISRAESVGSLEFRTASILGSSRGPSPLTIGLSDTIPLAVAFHEIIHAYFRGSDESRCQVKMSGDLMVSFPAGIVGVLANNPNPAKLMFRLKNTVNIESVIPNKQIILVEKHQEHNMNATIEFNMVALTSLLRRQSEQNPSASYFNVDILKYQIKAKPGATSCPFQLVSYWKCEKTHTDLKIDYKYNSHAMATASPLLNVSITVPIDGCVKNVQSKPHSACASRLGESSRLVWNFTDISQHSDNNGIDTLRARCELSSGPSSPSVMNTQFNCEGTTLSGIEFELVGCGYRVSLVKRRFISGKYICEGDGVRGVMKSPPTIGSTTSSPSPGNKYS